MTRFVGRANVRKRVAALAANDGVTRYGGGCARFELEDETLVVRPPFGLRHEAVYPHIEPGPLLEALARDHLVAAVLVRLGGYAVGVFEGERLAASKVGARFVKNRHKKGGSSSNRFRRRRDEQVDALVREAADVAARVLGPWRERVEFVALGGDRSAVNAVVAAGRELDWLRERTLPRFFDVPDPRQRVLEQLPYDLYAAEVTVE